MAREWCREGELAVSPVLKVQKLKDSDRRCQIEQGGCVPSFEASLNVSKRNPTINHVMEALKELGESEGLEPQMGLLTEDCFLKSRWINGNSSKMVNLVLTKDSF